MNPRRLFPLVLLACGQEVTLTGTDGDSDPLATDDDVRPDDVNPPIAVCGSPKVTAEPGQVVDLVGENSYDPDGNQVVSWWWEVVRQPDAASLRLSNGPANLTFTPLYAGVYAMTLVVTNDFGNRSTPCAVEVTVKPSQALYIELIPEYDDDDLALTLAPEGDEDDENERCNQDGCSVDWGKSGDASDDGVFLLDDKDGGPEVIAVPSPATGTFVVGAFDTSSGGLNGVKLADHDVTIVIYKDGVETWRDTRTFEKEGAVLPYAEITFPGGRVVGL